MSAELNLEKYHEAVDLVCGKLVDDKTFKDDYGNDVQLFRKLCLGAEIKTLIDFLNIFLEGLGYVDDDPTKLHEDTYMYAALLVLKKYIEPKPKTTLDELRIADNKVIPYISSLEIKGDLILGESSVLLVHGDLTVGGKVIADGSFSRLAISGNANLKNGFTYGEIIVAGELTVRETLYLARNDYASRGSKLTAKNLLVWDKHIVFPERHAEYFIDFWQTPDAKAKLIELFGDKIINPEGIDEEFVKSVLI
jgi:hypothetical protein